MQMTAKEKKDLIAASVLTAVLAFMDISGLPAAAFIHVEIADIAPAYFSLMVNFLLTALVFFFGWKLFFPTWSFGLGLRGFGGGLRRYGASGVAAFVLCTAAFCIGLHPFDYTPTVGKVLIEGFVYYIGVAIIEELYVRGLLLNSIERLFGQHKHASLYAVILSSLIFGIGHVFGALGSSVLTIISKVTWTVGLGIYLGAIYKKTNNLWVSIVLHALVDFCAWPFCFSTTPPYPQISLWILLIVWLGFGGYGWFLLSDKSLQREGTEALPYK